ncbi:MAG: hypothetical protein ACK52I_07675 [Pseudomonadota bacterium]|jgi:hypothetical protein
MESVYQKLKEKYNLNVEEEESLKNTVDDHIKFLTEKFEGNENMVIQHLIISMSYIPKYFNAMRDPIEAAYERILEKKKNNEIGEKNIN